MTVPITVLGQRYPSMTAAARALGVSVSAMHKAYHTGRPEMAGKLRGRNQSQPLTVNGVWYPSIAAAARALGRDPETLAKWKHYRGDNLTVQPKGKRA